MNRCDKLAFAGVIIVSLVGVAFTQGSAYDLYFGQMPIGKLLIAGAGWVIATYGPIVVASLFWRSAKRLTAPWLLHALLLPSFWVLLVAGNKLMLSTLNVPDFDDTLGAPILPGLFVMIATLAVYFLAVISQKLFGVIAQANGS